MNRLVLTLFIALLLPLRGWGVTTLDIAAPASAPAAVPAQVAQQAADAVDAAAAMAPDLAADCPMHHAMHQTADTPGDQHDGTAAHGDCQNGQHCQLCMPLALLQPPTLPALAQRPGSLRVLDSSAHTSAELARASKPPIA